LFSKKILVFAALFVFKAIRYNLYFGIFFATHMCCWIEPT